MRVEKTKYLFISWHENWVDIILIQVLANHNGISVDPRYDFLYRAEGSLTAESEINIFYTQKLKLTGKLVNTNFYHLILLILISFGIGISLWHERNFTCVFIFL